MKIGHNGALKPCYWFWEKIRTGFRNCYKGFYGINSAQCIQCTPCETLCTHRCVFCWRDIEGETKLQTEIWDEPKELVEAFIKNQKDIVKGLNIENYLKNVDIAEEVYSKLVQKRKVSIIELGLSKKKIEQVLKFLPVVRKNNELVLVDEMTSQEFENFRRMIKKEYENALNPKHAAISLSGEPMIYPYMDGLLEEFHKKGFTTFIVTNGTLPEKIESLKTLPKQLYVTLPAPNKEIYEKVCRPLISNGWERLMKTLELLDSLDTRTVIRITAVKYLNMCNPEQYRKLVEQANPWFFEVKGFTLEAYASRIGIRLGENVDPKKLVPTHEDIVMFAKEISENFSKFGKIGESKESRFVLMEVDPRGPVEIGE